MKKNNANEEIKLLRTAIQSDNLDNINESHEKLKKNTSNFIRKSI